MFRLHGHHQVRCNWGELLCLLRYRSVDVMHVASPVCRVDVMPVADLVCSVDVIHVAYLVCSVDVMHIASPVCRILLLLPI
jgi:hypothetical protein